MLLHQQVGFVKSRTDAPATGNFMCIGYDNMCHLARYAARPDLVRATPAAAEFANIVIKVGAILFAAYADLHVHIYRQCVRVRAVRWFTVAVHLFVDQGYLQLSLCAWDVSV